MGPMVFGLLPTVSFFAVSQCIVELTCIICSVREVEYGRGVGRNIEEAKEFAAYRAYNELYAEQVERLADRGLQ